MLKRLGNCLWNVFGMSSNPRPFQRQGRDLQKPVRHANAKFILVCPLSTELLQDQCENFIGNLLIYQNLPSSQYLSYLSTVSTLALDDVHKKRLCESARQGFLPQAGRN